MRKSDVFLWNKTAQKKKEKRAFHRSFAGHIRRIVQRNVSVPLAWCTHSLVFLFLLSAWPLFFSCRPFGYGFWKKNAFSRINPWGIQHNRQWSRYLVVHGSVYYRQFGSGLSGSIVLFLSFFFLQSLNFFSSHSYRSIYAECVLVKHETGVWQMRSIFNDTLKCFGQGNALMGRR